MEYYSQARMGVRLVKENRVLIAVLIALVIIGVVIHSNYLSFLTLESTITNQLRENQQIKTEHIASQIENHIRQVKEEITTLSKFPVIENLDINQCGGNMKIVHESIEGKVNSLLRVDEDGNIVECSSPEYLNYVGLNIKNKDYFIKPKETDEPYITSLVKQGASRQIIVSAPLFETTGYTPYPNFVGKFKGVLFSIVELSHLYNLYIHSEIDEEKSFFLLVNADSMETILKSDGIEDYADIKEMLPVNITSKPSKISDFGSWGKSIITSSNLVVGSDLWRFFVITPLENVRGETEAVKKRHLFSLGVVLSVIIGVFIFMMGLYMSKEKIQKQLNEANVTLEKFGIAVNVEKDRYTQADIRLDTKKLYLVKGDEENHAHELFIDSLNRGFAGLGIVRDDPTEIKKKYNLEKTSFIWLTKIKRENIPCETNIENLFRLIEEFIKKSEKSVILIDRLDYLITENRMEDVIKRIHDLKDLALSYECIIILSINPDLVGEPQLKSIEAETVDLYGKHLRSKVELSDIEMEILKFVNGRNVINKLISYKDITDNFKITKPTTRVKIGKLQNLGLLQVEQKGRFKSLRITSAGRRLIS